MHEPVLVLNANFEPINICTTRRAVVLILGGKAAMVANGRGYLRTVTLLLPRPSVIRLEHQVKRPRPRVKLARRKYSVATIAASVSAAGNGPTVDHVVTIPGGQHMGNAWPLCIMQSP
jgi:hypothetical protein